MCLCTSLIACLVVCMSFCLWDPSGEQLRLVAHFAEQQQVHRLRLPHRFFFYGNVSDNADSSFSHKTKSYSSVLEPRGQSMARKQVCMLGCETSYIYATRIC